MRKLLNLFLMTFLGCYSMAQNSKACQNGSLKIFLNTPDSIKHCVNTPYIPTTVTVTDSFSTPEKVSLTYESNVNAYKLGIYFDLYEARNDRGLNNVCHRFVWIVDCSLDVQGFDEQEFLLSANPSTNEFLNISFGNPSQVKKIEITSMNGSVYSEILDVQHENVIVLPVIGIYFLRISYADGNSNIRRVLRIN